ncbi:hypothetical protein R4Z10_19245 [Niallia sp. XMNu-256]|uniref:hypothetical protein n=1 Tax=Niallia sp. XMNu-256 TaxID=3082444 RepID=UPI0030CB0AAA
MKNKKVIIISVFAIFLLILSTSIVSAKLMAGKKEPELEQIGTVTTLENDNVIKINGNDLTQDQGFEKGEEYKVQSNRVAGAAVASDLGGDLFTKESEGIKFEPVGAELALYEKPTFLMDKTKAYTYKSNGETVKYSYMGKYDKWDKWGTNDGDVFLQFEDQDGLYTGWPESEYYIDIKYPAKVGTSWDIGYEGEGTAEITSLSKTVETPAGTFTNCLEIKQNGFTVYYAKNIGMIQSLQNGKVVSELVKVE